MSTASSVRPFHLRRRLPGLAVSSAAPCTHTFLYPRCLFASLVTEYSFLTVFVIELTLKIFGVGLVKFWRENVFNKVDFIAIVGAVFAEILFVAVLHNQRSAILQGFIFMRMLRLLRTLRLVRQFKVRQHSTQLFMAREVVSPWCATALIHHLHPGTHSLTRAPWACRSW